jgi:hypothetical protein
MTKLKPGEYSCGCGQVFKVVKFPHTRKCGCGVVITVVKPGA